MRTMAEAVRAGASVTGFDWERAWHEYQDARSKPNDAAEWDVRSGSFGSRSDGVYEGAFLDLAAIRPGETVLDMGCGTGLLAVPLAQAGCRVVCADFAPKMLESTERAAREAGVADRVETRRLAWDDDWDAAGLGTDCVDVAIASRSLATYHLTDALTKLDSAARRRVCLTVACGNSPCRDERAYRAVGRRRTVVDDHLYVFNILVEHGVQPELRHIVSHRRPGFGGRQAALEQLSQMMGGDLSEGELAALGRFLDEHYAVNPQANPHRQYEADEVRTTRWAFVSWDAPDSGRGGRDAAGD